MQQSPAAVHIGRAAVHIGRATARIGRQGAQRWALGGAGHAAQAAAPATSRLGSCTRLLCLSSASTVGSRPLQGCRGVSVACQEGPGGTAARRRCPAGHAYSALSRFSAARLVATPHPAGVHHLPCSLALPLPLPPIAT